MRLRFLILVMFLAVIAPPASTPSVGAPRRVAPTSVVAAAAQPAGPQQAPEPLTKGQLMNLVKAEMPTPQLVKLIHEHGIDFDLSDDYLLALRNAGAQEPVIQALRAARPKPLSEEQVMKLVAGGVPPERAATLVKQHGIDFVADEEYLKTLRLAGADDTLIAAVREAGKAVTAELVVGTSPDAQVYLDGEPQGRADAQGQLALKAKPGAHALKVSLKGKKDFEQSLTLGARQTTRIEARLEDLSPTPKQVRENSRDRLKYVWIPPGTFMMGCSPGDNDCFPEQKPAHQVTISRGFWIGQTPVTVGAYKRFAGATGRQMPDAPGFNSGWANENMPIVNVSWDNAHDYCGWIGGRLPTEAEWEYAARGGSTEARYGPIDEVAWYDQNSGNQTRDVAQKRANGFGLYDVLGNVCQWVNDWYDGNYYQSSPSQDPQGPSSGQYRVLRGGSWVDYTVYVRVSVRFRLDPANRGLDLGFRCVGEVGSP
jgi:formylglycine-generating enzyme required for sulfatase activity